MNRFTDADIRRDLAAWVTEHGLRGCARQLGVSPTMVSLVLKDRLPPGPKIATALGYVEDGLRWVKRGQ
jgi:hypothetical protein